MISGNVYQSVMLHLEICLLLSAVTVYGYSSNINMYSLIFLHT